MVCVAVKIGYVPITNDEAYTWQLVQQQYWKAMVGTANTHWLNTACVYVGSFFGKHIVCIRWHCALFYGVYLLGLLALAKQNFTGKYTQFLFVLVAGCHPYIIDYACLARGYIIAMAGVVWLLHLYLKGSVFNRSTALYAGIALLGNYSSLFIVIAIVLLYSTTTMQKRYWGAIVPLLCSIVLIVLAVVQLLFIGSKNDLVVGGSGSFISSTIYSFVYDGLYLPTQLNFNGWQLSKWVSYVVFIVLLFVAKYSKAALQKLSIILLLVVVLSTVAFWVAKVPFAMQRAALVYWPLLLVWLLLLAEEYLKKLSSWFTKSIAIIFCIGFMAFVLPKTSFTSCKDWLPDAAMPAVLADIVLLRNENSATPIAINHVQYGTWYNYYQYLPKYATIKHLGMVDFSGYPVLADSTDKKLRIYQFVYLCNRMPVLQYPFSYKEVKPVGSLGDSRLQLY
ncbi:MAG: hypothetical protein EAZ47_10130 [Bacteroidetes bacterium]|nr:MAG: hypothetical protein EAY72_03710 [Bacteroidota bacterium]TAE67950.1 MAG: hypothetical protein EAY68_04935 [Bacteroidota bacterium]TAF91254.1 MAG: hypothetical protein EAZ47_10130 [Bacteroidota bacterium]